MDNIVLTFNSVKIQLLAEQFMGGCRIFLSPFRKPHMGNYPYLIMPPYTWEYKNPGPAFRKSSLGQSSPPDSASIYVGVSRSWPRDLESIILCHMKFRWHNHMIFFLISSSNDRILFLSTML